jgi:hypothetical protein
MEQWSRSNGGSMVFKLGGFLDGRAGGRGMAW